ncbi:carboxylesterase/lipase family protein [Solimonas sp. K1W22B-7]|uniref:carboxylesterase/lipase family protein n=1 Tax=Solimonas sp. K1W22B-7 TaxID=2303331 RepID=UPI0013C4A5A7|nr:carboxylesterase family protein [Solimonas sp. K1W22B-7]
MTTTHRGTSDPAAGGGLAEDPDIRITIRQGRLRGHRSGDVCIFKGIPYAQPITARARWLPPQPAEPWAGEHDARHFGVIGRQYIKVSRPLPFMRRPYLAAITAAINGDGRLEQGDDQLTVNVWTPAPDPGANMPVMVWIHGGSFVGGHAASPDYDGAGMARRGLVFVSLQYRLGPPGILHAGSLYADGFGCDNRALLDQIAALRWVQDNIRQFGGDPATVTIAGQSAGAVGIYALAASPAAKGLFRRAIAMSGNPTMMSPAAENHRLVADALKASGLEPGDEAALLSLDHEALYRLHHCIDRTARKGGRARYGLRGSRGVGAYLAVGDAALPDFPLRVFQQGTPNDIDLMLGCCADDGQMFSAVMPIPGVLASRLILMAIADALPGGDVGAAVAHYRGLMPLSSRAELGDRVLSDAIFRIPTIQAAEAHAAAHPGRTWLYQVDWRAAPPGLRAIHGVDCALCLDNVPDAGGLLAADEATRAQAQLMADAWAAFARSGRPAVAGLPDWPAYDERRRTTMVFDRRNRLEDDYAGEFREYWPSAVAAIAALPSP